MEEITPERLVRLYKNLTDISEATELRLFDEKLAKITNLNLIPRIRSLNLSYNFIQEIEGLKHCPDLKEVNLSHNKISSVSSFAFEKNKLVSTLDLSYNLIERVAASPTFAKLQSLYLQYNSLTTIEFIGNCRELRVLNLSHNKIKRIDAVDYLTKLEELYVHNNVIDDIPDRNLKNNANLTNLDISFNRIKSLGFVQNLPSLQILNCSHNKIKKAGTNKQITGLENLNLSHNEFTALPEFLAIAPNVIILDFSSNDMLDFFDPEELSNLEELREVNFEDNFFVTKALEVELHDKYPYLEVINGRQFQRPGYIELCELEKMKEDLELAAISSEMSDTSDALSQVSANDAYDLAAVRKEMQPVTMKGKKNDNIIESEAEFKAFMESYQMDMFKLRCQHQSIVRGKEFLTQVEETKKMPEDDDDPVAKEPASQTSIRDTTPEKSIIRFGENYDEREGTLTVSEDAQRRLDIEKDNFRKLKAKANQFNVKAIVQSKNRGKLVDAISMSRTMKDKSNANDEKN